MPRRSVVSLLCLIALPLSGADVEPALGRKGRLLLEETFDAATLPAGWTRNTGVLGVAGGALHASELAADKHAGAFRRPLPLRDAAIQLDFTFAGATTFHVGFDPAPGELKKKGHLYSLIVTPDAWTITEHADKADPQSKNVVRAKAAVRFEPGRTYTLLLETKGDQVVARVAGLEPLRAQAKDFRVKKPGLVFRVGGKDGQGIVIDNLKVWELE
jgi:hypothetical protein